MARFPYDWEGLAKSVEFNGIVSSKPYGAMLFYNNPRVSKITSTVTLFVNIPVMEGVVDYLKEHIQDEIKEMEQADSVSLQSLINIAYRQHQ